MSQDQFSGDNTRTSSNQLLHRCWQVLLVLAADQLYIMTSWERQRVTDRLEFTFLTLSIPMALFSACFTRNPWLQKSPRLILILWTMPLLTAYSYTLRPRRFSMWRLTNFSSKYFVKFKNMFPRYGWIEQMVFRMDFAHCSTLMKIPLLIVLVHAILRQHASLTTDLFS